DHAAPTGAPARQRVSNYDLSRRNMTLVFVARINNYPILFGDLLISSALEPTEPVSIPTVGHVSGKNETYSFYVSGLCQKLSILRPHIALGWAGSKFHAQGLFRYLRQTLPIEQCTADEILAIMKDSPYFDDEELEIVGASRHGDVVTHFSKGGYIAVGGQDGEIRAAGSGVDALWRTLSNISDIMTLQGNPADIDLAFGLCIMLSSALLGQETLASGNLPAFFGGGFEMIASSKGEFFKIGDITYLFWGIDPYSPSSLGLYDTFITSQYVDEYMFIRAITVNMTSSTRALHITRDETYLVAPAESNVINVSHTPPLDFATRHIANYVVVPLGNVSTVMTMCKLNCPKEDRVRIARVDGGFLLEVPSALKAEIEGVVRSKFPEAMK
ncbi:MAG: hypothetical protein WD673_12630, partial [Alphaproteobacteria bacterium]